MTTEMKRIRIEPGSELARLLEQADDTPVLLEKNGEVYRLTKEGPAKSRRRPKTETDYRAFLASAGGWADVDIDKFLKDNAESRNLHTRPPVEL
jgi:hypothetical protein